MKRQGSLFVEGMIVLGVCLGSVALIHPRNALGWLAVVAVIASVALLQRAIAWMFRRRADARRR